MTSEVVENTGESSFGEAQANSRWRKCPIRPLTGDALQAREAECRAVFFMLLKKIQVARRKLTVDLIGETRDEMLRLIVFIKYGEERASRIIS